MQPWTALPRPTTPVCPPFEPSRPGKERNTILVTGATGTIGRELVQQFKAFGAHVIAGSSSGKTIGGVETRRVDFADAASLASALQDVDALFLLLPLQANMAQLASNAVAAARTAGVKHIVRSSGAGQPGLHRSCAGSG